MMDAALVRAEAARLGFDCVRIARPRALERWQTEAGPDARWADLASDPARLEGARRIIFLFRGYQPYEIRPGEATLSAYYPCAQQAYRASGDLAAILTAHGMRATAHARIPYKAAAALAGFCAYGRNGLTAMVDAPMRYHIQAILTSAPLESDETEALDGLAPACAACGACLFACPGRALDGTGRVDMRHCVRALAWNEAAPQALRAAVGASLIGCDACQDVCPRMGQVKRAPMPDALARALALPKLLAGDVGGLIPFIGPNYARKKRVQARACLIAANLGRVDCVEQMEALAQDEYEAVRVHARWALAVLSTGAPLPR